MTPAALQDGEVQYYASSVLVKKEQYYATLTDQRLIIEGPKTHEFKAASIQGAYPERLDGGEPGLKLIISTPKGQRDMIWAFPLDAKFKEGEQTAWINAVKRATGDKPFASGTFTGVENSAGPALTITPLQPEPAPEEQKPADGEAPAEVNLIRGESVAIKTAGVRVKHSYYTIYLTNLRLILQNNLGKIGREFAIAEIKDAAAMESDAGDPEIALSVGMQAGLKQMLLVFPTAASRDAWMAELQNKLPRRAAPAAQANNVSQARIGTFVPATSERVLITTPGVHIKNKLVVVHLTNTRFVVDSANGIVGEFAISVITRAIRMASELGEPGISMKMVSAKGEREMHLVFPSMNDREAWMDALQPMIPDAAAGAAAGAAASSPYTITTVRPHAVQNTQMIECPSCGAVNPSSEAFCAMCGSALHGGYNTSAAPNAAERKRRRDKGEEDDSWPPKGYHVHKDRPPYTGGIIGFISRPRDAFEHYAHESPKAAFPPFLIFGAIWAVVTTLFITYLLPLILRIDHDAFPIFTALQENLLLLIIFILMLWVIWIAAVLLHAVITGLITRIFQPSSKFPEVIAITMRSSLTFAVVGWIPIIGMFAASIWMAIETWFGLRITQDTSAVGAAAAAFVGMIVVYAGLFLLGGGFA